MCLNQPKKGAKLLFASTSEVYGDPKTNPDLEKVQKIINWFPNTSLEDGITKTILWFKIKNL